MDIDLVFKIAATGIIGAVLNPLLIRSGREDQAMMTTLAGLIVVLTMLVRQISDLFVLIKALFELCAMILLCKLAAAVFVAAVLTLLLKKDQPAFAFLVSACTAAGLLAVVVQQVDPWLDWLRTLDVYFQGQSPAVLLRVLGIALVAQFAADTCKEAGLSAAATAVELCGRVLALLQALPLLQSLLGSFADYLQ